MATDISCDSAFVNEVVEDELSNTSSQIKFTMFVTFENIIDDGALFHRIAPLKDAFSTEDKRKFVTYAKRSIAHYGSNPYIAKFRKDILGSICLLENKMPIHNPFLQLRGYRAISTYMHVYWNHLEEGLEYIGFSTNDMAHNTMFDDEFFNEYNVFATHKAADDSSNRSTSTSQQPYENDTNSNDDIQVVETTPTNPQEHRPTTPLPMFLIYDSEADTNTSWSSMTNLQFYINSYNHRFKTNYQPEDILSFPRTRLFSQLYPVDTFKKLGYWFASLLDDIFRGLPQTPWGINAIHTEEAMAVFHAIQMKEGIPYYPLPMEHLAHYDDNDDNNNNTSTNNSSNLSIATIMAPYDTNIRAKWIDNITKPFCENATTAMHKVMVMNNETKTLLMGECTQLEDKDTTCIALANMKDEPQLVWDEYCPEDIRMIEHLNETFVLFVNKQKELYCFPHSLAALYNKANVDIDVSGNEHEDSDSVDSDDESTTQDDKPNVDISSNNHLYQPIHIGTCLMDEFTWAPFSKDNNIYLIIRGNSDSTSPHGKVYRYWNSTNHCEYVADIAYGDSPSSASSSSTDNIIAITSNLVQFYNNVYIGLASKEEHIVAVCVDTQSWQIVYVSNPIALAIQYDTKDAPSTLPNSTILNSKRQTVHSLCKLSANKYLMTVQSIDNVTNKAIEIIYELLIDVRMHDDE